MAIKAIKTKYNGLEFRSQLEAQWAVFIDAAKKAYEYEPQGFKTKDGLWYKPDFCIHNVKYYIGNYFTIIPTLWLEVKGVMTKKDMAKILSFAEIDDYSFLPLGEEWLYYRSVPKNPVLILRNIPLGKDWSESINGIIQSFRNGWADVEKPEHLWVGRPFSTDLIFGECFPAIPAIDKNGELALFCHSGNQASNSARFPMMDFDKTLKAYNLARQVKFDHGQTPSFTDIQNAMIA